MFPGCPEHCNAEGTHSEYSQNIACRLGSICEASGRVREDPVPLLSGESCMFLKESSNKKKSAGWRVLFSALV